MLDSFTHVLFSSQQDKAEVFQPSVTTVKNLNLNFAGETSDYLPTSFIPFNCIYNVWKISKCIRLYALSWQYWYVPSLVTEDSAAELQDETKTSQGVSEHKTAPSHSQARDAVTRSVKKVITPRDVRVSRRVTQDIKPANAFTSSAKRSVARKSPRLSCKPSLNNAHKISPRQALKTPLNSGKECQNQKQSHETCPKTKGDASAATGQKLRAGDMPRKIPTVTFTAFGSHLKENYCPGELHFCVDIHSLMCYEMLTYMCM